VTTSAAVPISVNVPLGMYFIHPDHLNTPRLIADQSQQTVWRRDNQEPFGVSPPDENPSGLGVFPFPLRESNYYADTETGTFYAMFRDCYDSATGRFCQSDPIGLRGGLNTYAYAASNPMSFTDLTGLFTDCQDSYLRSHYGDFVTDTLVPYFSAFSLVNENREKFVTATAAAALAKGPIFGGVIAVGRIALAVESRMIGMFPIPMLTPGALLYGTGVLTSSLLALGGTAAMAFASTADFMAARSCAMMATSCGKQ
jgi:RHS repeat-associated protein